MFEPEKISVETERGEEFETDLADSFLRRAWGLSLRESGKMLFVFPRPVRAGIDMALLSRSLHLYFLDSEKKVFEVMEADPWGWDPRTWRIYRPRKKFSYLLESFEEIDIEKGDRVVFEI